MSSLLDVHIEWDSHDALYLLYLHDNPVSELLPCLHSTIDGWLLAQGSLSASGLISSGTLFIPL